MASIILIFTSCMTTTRIATYKITPVENKNNGTTIAIMPNTGRIDGFCFAVEDLSSELILIDWDKSYLLLNGVSYRCILGMETETFAIR